MQIHCVPRPGKEGRERPVYEAPHKFAFHHVNAWEADSATVVVDTLARAAQDFNQSMEQVEQAYFEGGSNAATVRRMVMRGTAVQVREFDMRDVPALGLKYLELPSPYPPQFCGKPHGAIFASVRLLCLPCAVGAASRIERVGG